MPTVHSLTPSFTTPDLPRCLAFYRDALGFTCTSDLETEGRLAWVELSHGPVRLMLLAAEEPEVSSARHDAAGVIFYFQVQDLAAVRADLGRLGLAVSPLEVTFYGMRECYVKDPDGRQLTLAEPSDPGDPITIAAL